MKQRTLFDELQLAIKGDGKIENQSSNPLIVRAEGDISQISDSIEELERLISTHVPDIQHELVTTEHRLNKFLQNVLKNKVVSIDTETNPLTRTPNGRVDPIAGFSAYTPGESAIYVPIDHDFFEGNLDSRSFFRYLHDQGDNIAILMHNSNYDVAVIESYAQVRLRTQVDTLIAGRVLNENERNENIPGSGYSLDYLWNKYVMGGKWSMSGSYSSLFNSRKFGSLNPEQVFKYASMDAVMTYQLAQFQMKYLSTNSPELKKQPDLKSVSEYFWNIEMPVLRIAQEMSSRGINYDLEKNKEVQKIYEERLRNIRRELLPMIDEILEANKHRIPRASWVQLDSPVNINSTAQIAIILYDALGLELNDSLKKQQEVKARKSKSKGPVNYRFTGSEAIAYFKEAYKEHADFLELFSTYKEEEKIYNTFIVKYRDYVNKSTGKIHTEWNTIGADTGRMSSKSPNLQQLPSGNPYIRPLFIPNEGNVFVFSDFSAQEPRILASLSKDPILLENFREDKDIYVTLISTALGISYESATKEAHAQRVKEWEDGGKVGPHPENLRDQGKLLQLALSYGLGPGALSEKLGISLDDAKQLMYDFKDNLNVVFDFEKSVKAFVRKNGYLKTIWGNKRRFPNYALPEIQVRMMDGSPLSASTQNTITQAFKGVWKYNERRDLKNRLELQYLVNITDNKELIQADETKILNSLIQGSGAGMLKRALILIYNDPILRDLGAFPILMIHDEIGLECPKENSEAVAKRLPELMIQAAQEHIDNVPFKSSSEVMDRWLVED